ncbi:MAG: restriction endonuclease [Methanomicrobia archaeon]|nr:restriction endonuclease [Methanomicrobia archaeon]
MTTDKDDFRERFLEYLNQYLSDIQDSEGNWTVKGFVDIFKNVYTISLDTKVISKVLEIMLFPKIQQFARENNFDLILSREQNFYPDLSFIDKNNGDKVALDIKSTYRTSETTVSGFTLGAFTGYFRNRTGRKNITFPYKEYKKHYVLGVIYTKQDERIDEYKICYSIEDLGKILPVMKDIEFILQEKYKIATDRPWYDNSRDIGSTTNIEELREGRGIFSNCGADVFDDYWMYYLTADMTQRLELPRPPYRDIGAYFGYKPGIYQRIVENLKLRDN